MAGLLIAYRLLFQPADCILPIANDPIFMLGFSAFCFSWIFVYLMGVGVENSVNDQKMELTYCITPWLVMLVTMPPLTKLHYSNLAKWLEKHSRRCASRMALENGYSTFAVTLPRAVFQAGSRGSNEAE